MRINKEQDIKDLVDKISDLNGKSESLKAEAGKLSSALSEIRTSEKKLDALGGDFEKKAELLAKNAFSYENLGLKHAAKDAYFESARSSLLEAADLGVTIGKEMVKSEIGWKNVGLDGMATFAAQSVDNLHNLQRIVTVSNKAIWTLERAKIPLKEVTTEMAAVFEDARTASLGLAVYYFRKANSANSASNSLESISYAQYGITFEIYSTPGINSFDKTKQVAKDWIKRFLERYDTAVESINSRRESFEEDMELFLNELEKKSKSEQD